MKFKKSERGSALTIVIIITAFIIILSSAFVMANTGEGIRAIKHEQQMQAHYNARSGVNIGFAWLMADERTRLEDWYEELLNKSKNECILLEEFEGIKNQKLTLIPEPNEESNGNKLELVFNQEVKDGELITDLKIVSTGYYNGQEETVSATIRYPDETTPPPLEGGVRIWIGNNEFNETISSEMFVGNGNVKNENSEVKTSVLEIQVSEDDYLLAKDYEDVFTGTNKDSIRVFKRRVFIEAPDDFELKEGGYETIFEYDVIIDDSAKDSDGKDTSVDVTLNNATFKGDVYIRTHQLKEIKNCTFEGNVYIETTGNNACDISKSIFKGDVYVKANGNFDIEGDSTFERALYVYAKGGIEIDGSDNSFLDDVYFEVEVENSEDTSNSVDIKAGSSFNQKKSLNIVSNNGDRYSGLNYDIVGGIEDATDKIKNLQSTGSTIISKQIEDFKPGEENNSKKCIKIEKLAEDLLSNIGNARWGR